MKFDFILESVPEEARRIPAANSAPDQAFSVNQPRLPGAATSDPPHWMVSLADPSDMPSYSFPFERLPPEILQRICTSLDYPTLISLSQANSFLQKMADPRAMASPASKFEFVVHAENFYSKHFPTVRDEHPGNFACYICFRVRDPAYFDAEQPHTIYVDAKGQRIRDRTKQKEVGGEGRAGDAEQSVTTVPLRRFCVECGVEEGLHRPGDLLLTKLQQELWVCKCWVVREKSACLRCPQCGGDCRLRRN
jgi:hypothetical protein